MALKTDYKDYIPPSGGRKYKITANSDGSSSVEDITQYQQVGDTWGAEDINQVNKLVNGAVYPNLGTNTNFPNPINQRGAASYTGDSTSPYCIDRWRISNGTTYTVGTFTLSAANYANRACGMWQTNLLGEHWLSIGDNVTVSIYANGQLHTAVMQVLDRDSYSSFADVPAGYTCDDFEIVLCTYAGDSSKYNLGVYPKKALTVNYIKWEKGSVATPYVPKGYGAELAECMRYFEIAKMGFTYSQLPSNYLCTTSFKVQKRTIPTVTVVAGSIKNLYESLIDTSVTAVSTTRDSIVSVALSQTVLNNQAITLTAVLSADL